MPSLRELLAGCPVLLAPMEDVSDAAFRRICRSVGAEVCVTEFVHAGELLSDGAHGRRKIALAADDRPTGIQIYGADPDRLLEAARIAERAGPAFVDLNCGCWVPRVAGAGAGAAWLRDPPAMVEMARRVVRAVSLPVTVKTRIGWGPESAMPIVDLARRLEDAGIAALAIHCRTAQMGHTGAADWRWARLAQEAVSIPVIVNGDIRTAADAARALSETGCAAAMIGRGAIDHPWIFREARALLAGAALPGPTPSERIALYRALLAANTAQRAERHAVPMTRRHLRILGDLAADLRPRLFRAHSLAAACEILDAHAAG